MKKNNTIETTNWNLLVKYLAGEVNEVEKSTLEAWINEGEENKREFNKARQLFKETGLYYNLNQFNGQKGIANVRSKINSITSENNKQKPSSRKIHLSFLKYAAVAIVVLAIGVLAYNLVNRGIPNSETQHIASAIIETRKVINLPDGTTVTLNSDTKLFYPEQFQGNTREVRISGEAFFDVTPDPDKPFIINAGEAQIKVLGTSFNVNAYPDLQTVEVVVETGRVQVLNTTPKTQNLENNIFLDPGDKAIFFKKDKKLTKKKNDDPNYNSWKTYSLNFNESKLSYVIGILEKTYHVKIETNETEIENLIYTAQFKNKPINFILDVIRLTFNLKLLVENDQYILKKQ